MKFCSSKFPRILQLINCFPSYVRSQLQHFFIVFFIAALRIVNAILDKGISKFGLVISLNSDKKLVGSIVLKPFPRIHFTSNLEYTH